MKTLAIYGPPGTGKTRALVNLINHFKTSTLCVSFTKAAASEIKHRLHAGVKCCTLHSLAYADLGLDKTRIVDAARLQDFSRMVNIPVSLKQNFDDPLLVGDEYLSALSYAKHTQVSWEYAFEVKGFLGSVSEFMLFAKSYEAWKKDRGFFDFDDMLVNAAGWAGSHKLIVVDEAQDLSPLQWGYLHRIIENTRPDMVVVAGDDDQAIYEWSGADPHGMQKFVTETKAEVKVLGQSYRVPANVHKLATKIADRISDRHPKEYLPRETAGIVRESYSLPIQSFAGTASSAILYRNHSLSEEFAEALKGHAVPYLSSGARPSPLQSKWGRAVKVYEAACLNAGGSISAQQMQLMCRAGNMDAETIFRHIQSKTDWRRVFYHVPDPILIYLSRLNEVYSTLAQAESYAVQMSSIHQFKGKEADNVVLIDGMSSRTAEGYSWEPDSELRVFYVGVTRAKDTLTIIPSDNSLALTRF